MGTLVLGSGRNNHYCPHFSKRQVHRPEADRATTSINHVPNPTEIKIFIRLEIAMFEKDQQRLSDFHTCKHV